LREVERKSKRKRKRVRREKLEDQEGGRDSWS